MARTAVVAGTATAVSNRVSRHQANKWAEQGQSSPAYLSSQPPPQQYEQAPPQYYEQPAPAQVEAAPDPIEQLKQLGQLHEQGILTDEEFAAQKAKILA
jgi:hypothetical protein